MSDPSAEYRQMQHARESDAFTATYGDLRADLLRLRAYDFWDDLTPAEREESMGYIRKKITALRELQKSLRRPENDELIGLMVADLSAIARRDAAKPPRKAAPRPEEISAVLASMNQLQLAGIMRMYSVPAYGSAGERQSIQRFMAAAESPIRRYALREHFSRIIAIRLKAGQPPA